MAFLPVGTRSMALLRLTPTALVLVAVAGLMTGTASPAASVNPVVSEGIARGAFPGAVVLTGSDGTTRAEAIGSAVTYGDTGEPLTEPTPMTGETVFDLASITKLFTAVAVMQLVERGAVELDAPVQRYLPAFTGEGKEPVTVRHLLTHTSGLPAGPAGLLAPGTRQERLDRVAAGRLQGNPGEKVLYSDTGFILLGALIEQVSGQRQDEYLRDHLLVPLGMFDTGYLPGEELRKRTAATEYKARRGGILRGDVHDNNAWALYGVAGHAGVFSTAPDLGRFAQMILDGGLYKRVRVLESESVMAMTRTDATPAGEEGRGLGFEVNQSWFMGALAGPRTVGHTGYTGTSLVINLETRTFAILLTNRLHPADTNDNLRRYRSGVGDLVATLAS